VTIHVLVEHRLVRHPDDSDWDHEERRLMTELGYFADPDLAGALARHLARVEEQARMRLSTDPVRYEVASLVPGDFVAAIESARGPDPPNVPLPAEE
jgi:hypothetical protein